MKMSSDSATSSVHRPNTAVGAHYLRLAADRGCPEAQVPPSLPLPAPAPALCSRSAGLTAAGVGSAGWRRC
jgi:hypothetical protein